MWIVIVDAHGNKGATQVVWGFAHPMRGLGSAARLLKRRGLASPAVWYNLKLMEAPVSLLVPVTQRSCPEPMSLT